MKLSIDQKNALLAIIEWYKKAEDQYLTLGGYAGTGKTTLLAQLRRIIHKARPKTKVAFCAYTGKASRVLNGALRQHEAVLNQDSVSTIHSLIYAPMVDKKGHISRWKLKSEIKADLILVDEASMVDESIWNDLISFDIPILAVGDHGQLPPINGQFNLMQQPQIRLDKIHRQAENNPIIYVSKIARETGSIPIKQFGRGVRKFDRTDSGVAQEVEELIQNRNEDRLILVGYNHSRIRLNNQIRQFEDRYGTEPVVGDKVICLKNNWEMGIYNGMSGVVESLNPKKDKKGKLHWYEAEIMLEDGVSYAGNISAHQFGQPTTLREFEGLTYKTLGDLFDYGYCLTVHKAQGSQAKRVIVFEERNKHMSDVDWRRWLYTAVTRAEEELYIIG